MTEKNAAEILITGATGNVGRELVNQLSTRKVPFRAMIRSQKDAPGLSAVKGAEIVRGDFDDAESLARALQGIKRAFLLTNSSERAETQQLTFVETARRAGVQRIVNLSQWATAADSPVRFLRYHAAVERKIKDSGIPYTFLRPNLFMQALLAFRETIIGQGKFFAAIGEAKVSLIDVRDIAAAGAAALVEEGHQGKTYNLTGPQALSHREIAEKLSGVLGRRIEFVEIPPEVMREAIIEAGMPVWQAEGVIEDYAHYSRGEAAEVARGVQEATGKPPRRLEDFLCDYAQAFSEPKAPTTSVA